MKLLTRFRKAAALPFVLLLVALNVVVVVALLVYATTELQASRNSGQAEVARALAQSGIDLAAGLIAANSTDNGFVSYQRIVTNVSGDTNPRLETKIANVAAGNSTMPWNKSIVNPAALLHSGFASGTSGVDLNFGVGTNTDAGFIAPRVNTSGWTNLSTNMFRMDWIYVYKGDASKPENLVGRVAYWVDDESSKININYSGVTDLYHTGAWDNSQPYRLAYNTPRPPYPTYFGSDDQQSGKNWPIGMEIGGVAGLTIRNAYDILLTRGVPGSATFAPYPSVLGARIGTINKPGGLAVTNLFQQSSFAFTATAFSSEDERTYMTGKKRFDILRMHGQDGHWLMGVGENSTNPTVMMNSFVAAITNNYPRFSSKYDLNLFAASALGAVKWPSTSNYDSSSRFYTRGLALLNEASLLVNARNTNGTNEVEIKADVELIVLWKTAISYNYPYSTTNQADIKAEMSFPLGTVLGCIIPGTNKISLPIVQKWFSYAGGSFGPTTNTLSNAIAALTGSLTNSSTNSLTWVFPDKASVVLSYNANAKTTNPPSYIPYMTNTLSLTVPTNSTNYTPTSDNWTPVYHMVAEPAATNGYRGDPRFGVFTTSVIPSGTNPLPAGSTLPTTFQVLNPNWRINDSSSTNTQPDLMFDHIVFSIDKGIPLFVGRNEDGTQSHIFNGPARIGEVPITNPVGSGEVLSWSTPRLWGDGRAMLNGVEYPPDWLLTDCFHFGLYPVSSTYSSDRLFRSYGRYNVNTAKSFFQISKGTTNQADTVLDSVFSNADTKDFRDQSSSAGDGKWVEAKKSYRTNALARLSEMMTNRTSTNTPYTTHFEFLADLAATNLHGNPDWWMAPIATNSTATIYTATNTTDRRIEGIVRNLNQKLTTHGNQFSIFSLAQALQVTPSGQTNVVGEAYLQAVYERVPEYNEATGAITNGSGTGAPPMRQLYLRELRY